MDLGNRGTKAVKVTVNNENEDGVVTLSRTQPRVGVPVTASLTDPDGSISGLRWQWFDDTIIDNEDALADERHRRCDVRHLHADSGGRCCRVRATMGKMLRASGVLHRR